MSHLKVGFRIDVLVDGNFQEMDEAAVAAKIASVDAAALREAEVLDGGIRIGDVEILDELVPLIHRVCFDAVIALMSESAVYDYLYFSSGERAQLRAEGDTVVLSGSDLPETRFPRHELLRGLYACGARCITTLDQLGRTWEVKHLQPFAAAAQSALAAAGLA